MFYVFQEIFKLIFNVIFDFWGFVYHTPTLWQTSTHTTKLNEPFRRISRSNFTYTLIYVQLCAGAFDMKMYKWACVCACMCGLESRSCCLTFLRKSISCCLIRKWLMFSTVTSDNLGTVPFIVMSTVYQEGIAIVQFMSSCYEITSS